MCAFVFDFSLKCYSEDIDKEALLFGTPMYIVHDAYLIPTYVCMYAYHASLHERDCHILEKVVKYICIVCQNVDDMLY